MKKILLILITIFIATTLSACSVSDVKAALKEEFPYFFCELMPPNPI